MRYQLYADRKTTRFLRATISLGKWLLIISLTFAAAFIVIWSMYETWEREEDNRRNAAQQQRERERAKEKELVLKVEAIRKENKTEVCDILVDGTLQCVWYDKGVRKVDRFK